VARVSAPSHRLGRRGGSPNIRLSLRPVSFPPNSPPSPIHCEECDGSKFFVYEDQTFICANCGTQYDWGPGANGNGHEQPELRFEADPELLETVRRKSD